MNAISNTAYYCCGIRMEDTKRARPICNDVYAEKFMDKKGKQIFEPFKSEKMPNISNIVRCRLIDDYLMDELAKNDALSVITIGAGFDTRPYRLNGGRWFELDEPQIVDYKNNKLPIEDCPNSLKRISIEFGQESLKEKLAEISGSGYVVIVIEGVFMYLDQKTIKETIGAVQDSFPQHVLYCDLMTKPFFSKFGQSIHSKLVTAGSSLSDLSDSPENIFIQSGYKEIERCPMVRKARDLGILKEEANIPKFMSGLMLNVFLKKLNGYAVHRFSLGGCP